MDTTFKAAGKTAVIDQDGKHHKVARGGILNAVNENSEIVAWVWILQTTVEKTHPSLS